MLSIVFHLARPGPIMIRPNRQSILPAAQSLLTPIHAHSRVTAPSVRSAVRPSTGWTLQVPLPDLDLQCTSNSAIDVVCLYQDQDAFVVFTFIVILSHLLSTPARVSGR